MIDFFSFSFFVIRNLVPVIEMDMATCCCCAEFHPDGEMEPSMTSGVGAVMRDGCATTTRWTVGARQWLAARIDHIHRRDRLSSY